jgi:hypothetical protein
MFRPTGPHAHSFEGAARCLNRAIQGGPTVPNNGLRRRPQLGLDGQRAGEFYCAWITGGGFLRICADDNRPGTLSAASTGFHL